MKYKEPSKLQIIFWIGVIIVAISTGNLTWADCKAFINTAKDIYIQTEEFLQSIPWYSIVSTLKKF